MILRAFPNLQWLKSEAEKGFNEARLPDGRVVPVQGWPSVILNVTTTNALRDNIKGPLSLFVNLSGESYATAGKHRARVDASTYFVSNADQYYSLEVDATKPVELFNIHFGQAFGGQVLDAMSNNTHAALNSPEVASANPNFHNRLYARSAQFNTIVQELARNPELSSNGLLREEHLAGLMTELLAAQANVARTTENLPSMRHAVREEVYARLALAVDYMHSHYECALSLDELAMVACFSKFHFLRLFRAAYGTTPARFLQRLRLEKARHLLLTSTLLVADIAAATGFGHPNAFIRAFSRAEGVSPNRFRLLAA